MRLSAGAAKRENLGVGHEAPSPFLSRSFRFRVAHPRNATAVRSSGVVLFSRASNISRIIAVRSFGLILAHCALRAVERRSAGSASATKSAGQSR
jgi:hypothetical protein